MPRRRITRTLLHALAVPLFAGLAAAAPRPAADPAAAAAPAEAFAPFLDDATMAVVAIDAPAVDVDALRTWFAALAKSGGMPAADLAAMTRDLEDATPKVKQVRTDLVKAGGRFVYRVGSADPQAKPFAVVPVHHGGDTAAVRKLLSGLLPERVANDPDPDQRIVIDEVPGGGGTGGPVLVWGTAAAVRQARESHADLLRARQPDLSAALAVGGRAAVRLAFAPPEQMNRTILFVAPDLPEPLGGGPTAPLVNAFKSATLTLDAPTAAAPNATIRLTVQAPDAAGAGKLKALLDNAMNAARQQRLQGPGEDKLFAALAFQVVGDRLALDLDQEELNTIATFAAPGYAATRTQAMRLKSVYNLRMLASGALIYTSEFKGMFPAALDNLKAILSVDDVGLRALLTNPSNGRFPGYVYAKPAVEKVWQLKDPDQVIIIHEAYDVWPAGGVAAAFADAHVETIASEEQLKAKLPK